MTRTILSLTILLATAPACQAKPEPAACWLIEYKAGLVTAASRAYLAKDAVKVVTGGGYEITARAPTWDASMVNLNSKKIYEHPAKVWQEHGFFTERAASDDDFNRAKTVSDKKINFRGLPSRHLVWKTLHSDDYYRMRSKPQICMIELTETSAIPSSKMQIEFLSAWYGVRHLEGVPLLWVEKQPDKTDLRLKAWRISKIPAANVSFKPTPGCTKVPAMLDLMNKKLGDTLKDLMGVEDELRVESKPKPVNKTAPKPPLKPVRIPERMKGK
ncbi:MAG: hypothetical protein K8F91_23050 [Candidatus Obscuribacterales bacterium]|nr:hypothetical protein [Candidatus Obscuribacterales bacterium]